MAILYFSDILKKVGLDPKIVKLPDEYGYMDEELIALLDSSVSEYLYGL